MPHPTVTPLKVNSEKNINIDNSRYLQMYIFRYFLSLVKIFKKKLWFDVLNQKKFTQNLDELTWYQSAYNHTFFAGLVFCKTCYARLHGPQVKLSVFFIS